MSSLVSRLAPLGAARIYLYAQNVDMRKSFDGLHAIIQSEFRCDALGGDLFLFLNRRRDRLKLMVWERDGWIIFYKRLEREPSSVPACGRWRDRGAGRHGSGADPGGRGTQERQTPAALPTYRRVARVRPNWNLMRGEAGPVTISGILANSRTRTSCARGCRRYRARHERTWRTFPAAVNCPAILQAAGAIIDAQRADN